MTRRTFSVGPPGRKTHSASRLRAYRRLYRKVAAEMLGRKLSPREQVHHLDGDVSNNLPANLAVVTDDEHKRLHLGKPFNPVIDVGRYNAVVASESLSASYDYNF